MSNSMTEHISRRMMMANPPPGLQQQVHKDMGDERYRDLRRARKLRFFVNGDRYFRGKKLYVTPNRYYNFNDLLNDLTGKLPSNLNLPYGVRQIFTPVGGRRIFDIEDLSDGETYVCAGFEGFKTIKYGKAELEPWSMAKPQQNAQQEGESEHYGGSYRYRGYANNAFHPGRYFRTNHSYQQRRWPGTFGNNAAAAAAQQRGAYPANQSENIPTKPKVVTIVRNGAKPRQNVKILLNRRSVQSFEQLLSDISEAFGPKYRQSKVRKLFTVRGREVQGISDFFRDDECFVALGVGDPALADSDVAEMLEELFPEGNVSKSLMKEWDRNQRRRKRGVSPTGTSVKSHANHQHHNLNASHPADKRDSGFDSSDASTNRSEPDHSTGPAGYRKAMNQRRKAAARELERERERDKENQSETGSTSPAQHGYYLMKKLEKERLKVAAEEKERTKRRQQKMADAEKRVSEEERRKRGQVPAMKNINDPFRKGDDAKEREKDEAKRRKEEERRRKEEERVEAERKQREKEKVERDAAEKAARERMALAEREEKEKQEKERIEREKQEKSDRERKEKEKAERKKSEKDEAKRQSKGDKLPAVNNKDKDKEKQGKSLGTHKQTDGINTTAGTGAVEPDNNNNDTNSNTADTIPPDQPDPQTQNNNNDNNNKDNTSTTNSTNNNKQQQKEKKRLEKEQQQQQQKDKDLQQQQQTRKRAKTKIVRRTKAERQVAGDDVILQKYDLGRKLGDGNFAIVRQSRKKDTSQEYAIKVIDKAKLKGKEHMVENEIDIMKDCSHHNIVRLYEEFETLDKLYLVMELVKGGDLFDAITQSVKFGEMDSSLMVRDLGNALFYLHSRSIVHRDLKPENLLVHRNKDGSITLKLADFGLAMEVKELIYTVCGTPTYVAPEILTEIGYGLEVDMWAVGVITYILLCGFPPFRSPDRNQTELFEYIKAGEYEFLSPYWDNTSKDAKDLIQHLLVVDRRKRYTPVDVLSHKWVVCCGDTDRKPEGAHSTEQACKETRKELEGQAKLNYESYQRLKEKKRRERERGLVED